MPTKEARKRKREIREEMRHALPKSSKEDIELLVKMYFKSGTTEPYRDFAAAKVREIEEYWAQDFDKVRTDRGISKEIWEARPYLRWPDPLTQGDSKVALPDISAVTGAYWGLGRKPEDHKAGGPQRAFMTRLANQSPGWVITRHAVPGADHVYAEIRPDSLVETGPPVRHWHGSGEPPEEAYEPGVSVLERGSEAWKDHCRKVNEANEENEIEAEDHRLVRNVHEHPDVAKYVFPTGAKRDKPWKHDHRTGRSGRYYKKDPDALERHLANWHNKHPETVEWFVYGGLHEHTRRVKNRKNKLATRIDIHPMALPLLNEAEIVYFGIEGCLKADSILSAILREGQKASVFSVPSVSLWHADELERFAREYLRGKTVIVVPDADWVENDKVISQARQAEFYLRETCGVRAYVAAPPLNPDRTVYHKGVDDYLGDGGTLAELVVMERTVSPMMAVVERRALYEWGHRRDRVASDVKATKALAHQGTIQPSGEAMVQTTLGTLGRIIGRHRQTAFNIVGRIERDAGWVRMEGKWETQKGYHTKEGFFPSALEFKKSKLDGSKKEQNPRIFVRKELCGEDREWELRELPQKLV